MEATMSSVETFASMEAPGTTAVLTGEAAVPGVPRPAVDAVIDVLIVVSFMMLPITKVLRIAKVVPIAIVTKVSIKIMVEVAEEQNRRVAHVKR
jgi:hypothetical protein